MNAIRTMTRLNILAALVGVMVGLATPVFAGPNDCPILLRGFLTNDPALVDAFAAFESGDCPKALKIFKEFSARENANAQNNVGVFYEAGLGLKKNDEVAERWYRKAAERGQIDAQFNLATILVADLMMGLKPRDQRTKAELFVEALKWVSLWPARQSEQYPIGHHMREKRAVKKGNAIHLEALFKNHAN